MVTLPARARLAAMDERVTIPRPSRSESKDAGRAGRASSVVAADLEPLWWSLALGACLGGNATIVGASANVVVANMAGRAGHPISFVAFLRYGLLVTFVSLAMSTVYLYAGSLV